jgi:hypothetical protein
LIAAYSEGLGVLGPVDQSLIRTAALLSLKLESLEEALASGQPVDSDELIRLASTSRRALQAVSAKATVKPAEQAYSTRAAAASAVDNDGEADDGDDDQEETEGR